MADRSGFFFISKACDKLGDHGSCKSINCKCTCHPNAGSAAANPSLKIDYEKPEETNDE